MTVNQSREADSVGMVDKTQVCKCNVERWVILFWLGEVSVVSLEALTCDLDLFSCLRCGWGLCIIDIFVCFSRCVHYVFFSDRMPISHKETIQYDKVDRKSRAVIQCREAFSLSRVHEIQVCTCYLQKWVIFFLFWGVSVVSVEVLTCDLDPRTCLRCWWGLCIIYIFCLFCTMCSFCFFSDWVQICHKEAIQYNEVREVLYGDS